MPVFSLAGETTSRNVLENQSEDDTSSKRKHQEDNERQRSENMSDEQPSKRLKTKEKKASDVVTDIEVSMK